MSCTTKCNKCGSILKYDKRSVWEGCREMEEYECPVCGNVIDRAFTDLPPYVSVIEVGKGYEYPKK